MPDANGYQHASSIKVTDTSVVMQGRFGMSPVNIYFELTDGMRVDLTERLLAPLTEQLDEDEIEQVSSELLSQTREDLVSDIVARIAAIRLIDEREAERAAKLERAREVYRRVSSLGAEPLREENEAYWINVIDAVEATR